MLVKKIPFLLLLVQLSAGAQSTASNKVSTFEIEAPQLDTVRKIWVYLPANYNLSEKRYPVVYMHDAQNLFDAMTSFSGEWKVDELLDSIGSPEVIVIGIEHGNNKRIAEFTPFPHDKHGGGEADQYLDFLRKTLKPHVDSAYRTLPEAEKTSIVGSSLGGLVSFYAAMKYPDTFGQAGVFSPSFWFSDEIYRLAENAIFDTSSRFYFVAGTAEDEQMVPNLQKMFDLLKEKLPQENVELKIVEGGEHNEDSWSKQFPEAIQWLYPEPSQVIFKVKR